MTQQDLQNLSQEEIKNLWPHADPAFDLNTGKLVGFYTRQKRYKNCPTPEELKEFASAASEKDDPEAFITAMIMEVSRCPLVD